MTTPGSRKPMLATRTDSSFTDEKWIFERKLDGVRTVCSRAGEGESPQLWSRNQRNISASYPEIVAALAARSDPRYVADGELVAFAGNQTSFARLQQRIHRSDGSRASRVKVYYYLFDLLFYDTSDTTVLPLWQRKQLLAEAFDFTDPLRFSAHRETDGIRYFTEACARGWEGLIAKRADSQYRPGRSHRWLKLKCFQEQELVLGGYTDPAGSRSGFGALLVGYYERGRLRYAGKVGSGYDENTLRGLRSRMDELAWEESPFGEPVGERGVHWVDPRLVVQVRFSEWTEEGKLRHPRFVGLRADKNPTEVVREMA